MGRGRHVRKGFAAHQAGSGRIGGHPGDATSRPNAWRKPLQVDLDVAEVDEKFNRDVSPHYTATIPADVRSGLCCRWPAILHPCYATRAVIGPWYAAAEFVA